MEHRARDRHRVAGPPEGPRAVPPAPVLHGRRLALARAVWVLVAVVNGLKVAAANLVGYARLRVPCAGVGCAPSQLSPHEALTLQGYGFSLGFYAGYYTV